MLEAGPVARVALSLQGRIKEQIGSRFSTSRAIGKLVGSAQIGFKIQERHETVVIGFCLCQMLYVHSQMSQHGLFSFALPVCTSPMTPSLQVGLHLLLQFRMLAELETTAKVTLAEHARGSAMTINIRRIVTGHDANGKAVVRIDDVGAHVA